MNWKQTVTIFFLGFIGLFFHVPDANAYSYNIKCPTDQQYFVVVITDKTGQAYETTGAPNFDPFPGQEICFPTSGTSIKKLAESKVISQGFYYGKGVSNVEILECTEATFGGSDKFDWDNVTNLNVSYDKDFVLGAKAVNTDCNQEKRIRYEIGNSFFYNVGLYKPENVSTNNPEAVKALCLNHKSKDECNADAENCFWHQHCKPKAIGEADHKKSVNENKNGDDKNIICTSVINTISAKCAAEPDLCKATCQQYSKCIYYNQKCEDKTSLTQEQLRELAISSADEYLKAKYPVPKGYLSKILPDCAFSGTCRSINDLLILGINIAKFLFSMIGTVAFAMFVYGGTRLLLSGGNNNGIQAGKDAMINAVIGITISFSAYLIVSFLLNLLQVGAEFKAIGYLVNIFV